jgi:uncharacterized membrane protein YqgA involved in biofilm formation
VFRGAGTALNVLTVLVGSGVGVLLGHRLPQRTRDVVTDGLGLVTLLVAATSAAAILEEPLSDAVGTSAPVLIVLGAILVGGVVGSLLGIEDRLERVGAAIHRRLPESDPRAGRSSGPGSGPSSDPRSGPDSEMASPDDRRAAHHRFVEGFVAASLLFCVGPLTILGSLDDGLGRGIDKLALKAVLDGFAAIAFADSLGWGVAASALVVAVVQGSLTALGYALGGLLPQADILALTATGGLLLVGVALRLLRVKQVPVADLLPALVVAPLLVEVVGRLR